MQPRGIKSLPMLKCSSERWVWAPQSLSAGTLTSPRPSLSVRYSGIMMNAVNGTHAPMSGYCGLYNCSSVQARISAGRSTFASPSSNMNSATRVAVVTSTSRMSAWDGNSMPRPRCTSLTWSALAWAAGSYPGTLPADGLRPYPSSLQSGYSSRGTPPALLAQTLRQTRPVPPGAAGAGGHPGRVGPLAVCYCWCRCLAGQATNSLAALRRKQCL